MVVPTDRGEEGRGELGLGGDDLDPLLAGRVPPDALLVQRVGRNGRCVADRRVDELYLGFFSCGEASGMPPPAGVLLVLLLPLLPGSRAESDKIVYSQDRLTGDTVIPPPKPRMPTLVYYPHSAQHLLWRVYEDEIGFNNDNNEADYFQDIPDSFQYKINCDSKPADNPWIPDIMISKTISPTTCKTLLKNRAIQIKISSSNTYIFNVNLIPIPQIQSWQGYSLASYPGQQISRLSDCCDATVCTDRCLEKPQAQKCYMEIYILETLRRVIAWGPMMETYAIGLRQVFRIPCDYCPLVNCVRQCSYGEYATNYSDFQV